MTSPDSLKQSDYPDKSRIRFTMYSNPLGSGKFSNQCAATNSLFHETGFFSTQASCYTLFGVLGHFLSFVSSFFVAICKGKVIV